MKRIIYTITLLGGLACCWNACSKDDEETIEKQKNVTETEITDEPQPDENTSEGTTKAYTYSNPVTIAMGEEYGTLKDKLGDNLETADKLIITGKIDANDVQTFLNEMPALLAIDIAEVTFVETSAKFCNPHYSSSLSESLKENLIGSIMFYQTDYQEIVLPKTVTKIEEKAFCWCDNLVSVTLPDELIVLENQTFNSCSKLKSIILPDKLEKIGSEVFSGCNALTSITLSPTLKEIGEKAFYGCGSLSEIELPQLESLGDAAFQYCSGLTSVIVSEGVEAIPNSTFRDCYSLNAITLPSTLTSIGDYSFASCKSFTTIELPASVTSLGERAFDDCAGLTKIVLPDNITELPYGTFWSCKILESVHLPANLKKIGRLAFDDCDALTSIELPSTLEEIGEMAFYYSGLSSIDLTNTALTTLGNSAFEGLNLTTIKIPTSVTSIPDGCFRSCSSLESVSLPEGLISIGNSAFQHCSKLSSINLPSTLTSIGDSSFEQCKVLGAITLPSVLQAIGYHAFYGCDKVTFDPRLPESLTSIGSNAFAGLHSMKEFIFPSSITALPAYVCELCATLESVTISEGCTIIGDYAFQGDKLKEINLPSTLKTIGAYAFLDCGLSNLNFLNEGLETIGECAFSKNNLDGTLTKLPSTVTEIGEMAFSECNLTNLDFLNEGLKTIGDCAFDDNNLSGDLTLPSTVESIGNYAFRYSDGITSIHLGKASGQITLGDLFNKQVNCLIYVPAGCSVSTSSNIPNIIVGNKISSLVLVEESPFACPEAFVAGKVTFTKQFNRINRWDDVKMTKGKSSNWYGLSLPFKVDKITTSDGRTFAPFGANTEENCKPFWLRRLSSSGDFSFENVTSIEAGEPYIIAFPNSDSYAAEYNVAEDVTFSASGTITIPVTEEYEVSGGFNCMKRNYATLPPSGEVYLLNSPHDGNISGVQGNSSYAWGSYFIRSLRTSWAFEAYVTSSSGAAAISINPATPTTRSSDSQGSVPSIDDM